MTRLALARRAPRNIEYFAERGHSEHRRRSPRHRPAGRPSPPPRPRLAAHHLRPPQPCVTCLKGDSQQAWPPFRRQIGWIPARPSPCRSRCSSKLVSTGRVSSCGAKPETLVASRRYVGEGRASLEVLPGRTGAVSSLMVVSAAVRMNNSDLPVLPSASIPRRTVSSMAASALGSWPGSMS